MFLKKNPNSELQKYSIKIKNFYNKNQDFVISPFNPFGVISDFGKEVLDKYINELNNKKILDIGCGHGHLLKYLSGRGAKTYGVDISDVALKVAGHNSPKSKLVTGEGGKLPFNDNFFDYIICIETAEHFLNIQKAFNEMYRVIKKGGVLILSNPNYFNTAGILKLLLEKFNFYPKNTFAPFSNWKRQSNENFVTIFNLKQKLIKSGFIVFDQFTYNLLHGLIPFISVNWTFYRFWPIRKLRHIVERARYIFPLNKMGMNVVTVCQKPRKLISQR